MYDISKELASRNLSREDYLRLLEECSRKLNHETDKDWAEISQEFNLGWSGDCLRKACQPALVGSVFVKEFFEQDACPHSNSDQLYLDRKRELEQLAVQYRDERNAWAKQNREFARIDHTLNLLSKSLNEQGVQDYPFEDVYAGGALRPYRREMIVLLSDFHIGKDFDNAFGKYNSRLAAERLKHFAHEIMETASNEEVTSVHVLSLGDQINGNIHGSIAVTNKENVVDQIKKAAELISDFLYDLMSSGLCVHLYSVNGNHSRITKNKDDEIRDERLDNLICWIVAQKLLHHRYFTYEEDAFMENGIVKFNVMGKDYLAVHGDLDKNSSDSVASLCFLTKSFPEAIFRGHLHTPAVNMVNGVQVIQSGSLDGSGDDYTLSKRLQGYPSQTFVIADDTGIRSVHHVKLGDPHASD